MASSALEGPRRLATIAAVIWFEVVGGLYLAALALLSPFCWGSGCEATGVPESFRDGSLVAVWIGYLVAVAVGSALLWTATRRHPVARGSCFTVLGAVAASLVVGWATSDGLVAVFLLLWSGIPAVLLLGSWLPVVAGAVATRAAARRL